MQFVVEQMIPDGNCLFRALSYCIYKTQDKHAEVRFNIVEYVTCNWSSFQHYVIGDESNGKLIRSSDEYKYYMQTNGIYGGEVEMTAAARIYNLTLSVYRCGDVNPVKIGIGSAKEFFLLFTGDGDSGHFDVIEEKYTTQEVVTVRYEAAVEINMNAKEVSCELIMEQNATDELSFQLSASTAPERGRPSCRTAELERRVSRSEQQRKYRMKHKQMKNVAANEATQQNGMKVKSSRGRPGLLITPEERCNLRREQQRKYYERKKQKKNAVKFESAEINEENTNKLNVKRKINEEADYTTKINKKRKIIGTDSIEELSKSTDESRKDTMHELHNGENDNVCNYSGQTVIHGERSISTEANKAKRSRAREIAGKIYNGCIWKEVFKTVEALDIGEMTERCRHCSAASFKNEPGRVVNNCCHGGKVKLPPLTEYPVVLEELREGNNERSRHYRQMIRSYNDAFAFASFNCTVAELGNSGPHIMKIVGDVSYTISTSLEAGNNRCARYGQIYIYDQQTQLQFRENNVRRADLLETIGNMIIDINPYAANFKTLHERYSRGEHQVVLNFIALGTDDRRRYNTPTCGELAALIVSRDGSISEKVDVQIFPKHEKEVGYVPKSSHHVDPMTFPLLFPSGDLGWNYNMKQMETNKTISPVQYYGYRLALREGQGYNRLLRSGRLTQHYVIHAYLTIESQRLLYLRNNQKQLRVECYLGMTDHVLNSEANTSDRTRLGNVMILPSTFSGSMRHMQQQYQDAMAITRKVGRPDLFITMTCNPKWIEIRRVLRTFPPGTTANDIPTIVCRIFNLRLQRMLNEITTGSVFGKIDGYVYTIEFQKRGLPHAHMLFIMNNEDKLLTPEAIDNYISAEIPDKEKYPELHQSVTTHMLHGPHTARVPCWNTETRSCAKKFPKDFTKDTDISANGFPKYRRRMNNGVNYYHNRINGRNIPVDNSMVVPHNPYLLAKYDCHLNVEYCASVMATKYIFKYINKGHDRARVQIDDGNTQGQERPVVDEIKEHVDTRYVSPMEAAWRILELPMHGRSHAVTRLPVHLPGHQYATFEEGREEEALTNDKKWKTPLTAWFELNTMDQLAQNITYANMPDYYTFKETTKTWSKRKIACKVASRMTNVSPRDVERFHLKLILGRITGAKCFKDLCNINGIEYNTFREAAVEMGLTVTNDETFKVFDEAVSILMPKRLRHFFVWYLIGEMPSDVIDLWNKYKTAFSEDFTNNNENRALCAIEHLLQAEGRSCENFGLPTPEIMYENEEDIITPEKIQTFTEKGLILMDQLNTEQRIIYDAVMESIRLNDKAENDPTNKCFFIDGPGGTGKTFLYNAIYYMLRSRKKTVACVAWTGIAAILLPCGTTAHKMFGLPLTLTNEGTIFTTASMKKKMQSIDVIIWDECSMIPKTALELIDRTLKDIMKSSLPFGGKTVILGGDFRQVLPIVKRGGKRQIIDETIKHSSLWNTFEKFSLNINMRAKEDTIAFSEWLLSVGNGEMDFLEPEKELMSNDLITELYPLHIPSKELINTAILAPLNVEVNQINTEILRRMKGDLLESRSIDYATLQGLDVADTTTYEEATLRYPIEYLNALTPTGLPPHNLQLKIGAIVMMLRNLSISDGICNGTRLVVLEIHSRILIAELLTGEKKGQIVEIPRIKLDTRGNMDMPFILHRRQFPVRLAFAMTINKSQGQSFEHVGLYIDRPIFGHGQLYVALSRCKSKKE